MEFLAVLAVATVAVFVLRNPLKKTPVAFYVLASVVAVMTIAGTSGLLGPWWRPAIPLAQRCMAALALFTIVMYIGVLPKDSKASGWLRPVRAELSIVAWILCLGHMCAYALSYAQRILAGSMSASMLLAFCIAVVLFLLLLVLGATSFNVVKRRMPMATWKNLQRLAYLFFALVYAHMLLMLVPAAAMGGARAQASIVVYSAVFALYAVLRLRRAGKDRASRAKEGMGHRPGDRNAPSTASGA